jgi:Na+-transporting NADH:ubiquinone oxidoreductase subunit NqrC
MNIKIIVALIGIVSVLVSALVQFLLGRQSEARKQQKQDSH